MTHPRLPGAALLAALGLVLASCASGPSPAALNGTYVGDLRDASVGYLGSHAMQVTTAGDSFAGTYCFVALTGESVCNAVRGSVTGTSASGSVTFTVGAIDFWGSVQNDRDIRGNYAFSDGSGSFDMRFDPTARPSNLAPLGAATASRPVASPAAQGLIDALEDR